MSRSLLHRGPDDEGTYESDRVAFGFRRLSILDLSLAGHQPMATADGQTVIVFNGEIFNYVELRQDLEARGHEFRSTGDTEVLLHAYREWGAECLTRLNGMWAFLIHDRRRGRLFGSRDRFGIKPLYWHRAGDTYLFGSEIKAIRASGLYRARPNWGVLSDFLINNHRSAGDCGEETFFEDVQQVLPGMSFELDLDSGAFRQSRYWSLESIEPEPIEDLPEKFAELFEDSVRLRLRSDVPVGVCLSGGLDSTSILCAMARLQRPDAPLEAFCYHADAHDEREYINDTLAQTDARLNRIELVEGVRWDLLPDAMRFYDQPVLGVTALVGYELMRLVADRGIKVVLNGQGADEALAGYPDFFPMHWATLMRTGQKARAMEELVEYAGAHGRDAKQLYRRLRRSMFRDRLRSSGLYRGLADARQKWAARRHPWFNGLAARHHRPMRYHALTVRAACIANMCRLPLPHELRPEDRNSMAHSIEARLPFLDYRLIELAFRIPDDWKLQGKWNKVVLRESMKGRIPESVRSRVDKMGFPTAANDWFAGPWYEPMQDLLASREARERGIYRIGNLREGLERHRRGEAKLAEPVLFNVAQVEAWFRTNVDESGPVEG